MEHHSLLGMNVSDIGLALRELMAAIDARDWCDLVEVDCSELYEAEDRADRAMANMERILDGLGA